MSFRIALGVTGSIAIYKSCELVRLLKKDGMEVNVVMTSGAEKFITELTFRTLSGNAVCRNLFDDASVVNPLHISLAQECDALVIAPCTANVMAKMVAGIADDSLTALALAFYKPIFVAPSMNVNMWNNTATQANVAMLRERGVLVLEPGAGSLASGTEGKGRMMEALEIFDKLRSLLPEKLK